ncbi:MAG: FAD-linked oxidase C-terminal domain-containing protein [Gammaproteobacteria bacterium]|jgi:glycolate oxidase|nr:FAD-linked oxidase C-terminal domain-containing protein [Gammaproteobacteria bacterium]
MEPKVHQPSIDPSVLLDALRSVLSPGSVLHEAEQLAPWECDGLSAYRQRPLFVCLPETVEQLQALLRLCHERQVPVVARGAGTGLSGGALPDAEGVLIGLAKFNRILEIDPANRLARVEPGVRNVAVSEASAVHGLYYAPDPSSQIACTIGGNIAENAGGVHCLKYGLTVHNVVAMKVLTMDGTLLELGGGAPDAPGYDLLALMTGSEGLLGIVVEATLRLLPLPASTRVLLAAFDSVSAAATTVGDIIGAGILPAGLELMDRLAIRAAEDYAGAGYPRDAAAILLCELDGDSEELDARMRQVEALATARGATRIDIAVDPAERRRLWAGRKAAFPAMGRIAPDYYCMDGTIPRRRLPEVLEHISEWSREYGLAVANVFHAGDGNLHPLILYDANRPGELERAEEFGGRILELCVQVGGTITGEHGVGVEKLDQMCVQFTDAELEQFRLIKDAFDPHRLLNRGKAVPTLHRCAELGRMHVHAGKLPHPELERF